MKTEDESVRLPDPRAARQVVNYTVVALVGMLAGLIIGFLFGRGDGEGSIGTAPPVSHPHRVGQAHP